MSYMFSEFFLPKLEKKMKPKNVFHDVAFNIIRIEAQLASQNEHQNLSFMRYIHVVGKKMTRNDHKITNRKGCDI